jgi:hypothetical protein
MHEPRDFAVAPGPFFFRALATSGAAYNENRGVSPEFLFPIRDS